MMKNECIWWDLLAVPAVYDGPSLVPFSVDDAYEVEQWSRVLRRLHVGPGGEVELLHLSTALLTHVLYASSMPGNFKPRQALNKQIIFTSSS